MQQRWSEVVDHNRDVLLGAYSIYANRGFGENHVLKTVGLS